ncbi:MAG: DUF2202 domain-containing protein [Pseudomonadota bacterium]
MANEHELAALHEALQDEYKALATYKKVIEKFGPVRPFINIVEAEGRHAQALLRQFERLGATPPENDWDDKVEAPSSLSAACKEAVAAELENAAMYDRLLRQIDDPAIKNVLSNLQDASQNRHLPAFQRCLEREERGEA